MSSPHTISTGMSEHEYYRRLQMAEGQLAAMTVAKDAWAQHFHDTGIKLQDMTAAKDKAVKALKCCELELQRLDGYDRNLVGHDNATRVATTKLITELEKVK